MTGLTGCGGGGTPARGAPASDALRIGQVPGRVHVVDDVPGAFAGTVVQAFAERPGSPSSRFALALSGGDLARRCYERLAGEAAAAVDWGLVDVLMGDERCVAPDDLDANQRLVRAALLDRVAPVGTFAPMSCDEGPEAYEAVLERLSPVDVVHLGFGPDGHTASLFSGTPALDAPDGRTVARSTDPSGQNPHDRMTLTIAGLRCARAIVVTASGDTKRQAFEHLAAGRPMPAALLPGDRTLWLVDGDVVGHACDEPL